MSAVNPTPAQSAEAVDLVQRAINRWFSDSPPTTQRAAIIEVVERLIVDRDRERRLVMDYHKSLFGHLYPDSK